MKQSKKKEKALEKTTMIKKTLSVLRICLGSFRKM